MITIKDLKKELEGIKDQIQREAMTTTIENRLRKRITYLNTCIKYLESHPDESGMKDEVKNIEKKISLRMSGFVIHNEDRMNKKDIAKMRKAYEKEYEIPKLRLQAKTLKFILKAG